MYIILAEKKVLKDGKVNIEHPKQIDAVSECAMEVYFEKWAEMGEKSLYASLKTVRSV